MSHMKTSAVLKHSGPSIKSTTSDRTNCFGAPSSRPPIHRLTLTSCCLYTHIHNSRYLFDMRYRFKRISKELYEWCLDQKYGDKALIAKWKKVGGCKRPQEAVL